MSPVARALAIHADEVARLTDGEVDVGALRVTDRAGELPLGPAGGQVSPNGACRLFRAADGWMALNLARDEDRDLVPAWLACGFGGDPWELVEAHAPGHRCHALVDQARLLGLPAGRVGEVVAGDGGLEPIVHGDWATGAARPCPKVVDLSALWAGPLCGAILAAAGCEVTKVESLRRPDPTREHTPAFYARLNGGKAELSLDLSEGRGQARLGELILDADVVITSARPRGLRSLGLDPAEVLRRRRLTWVAITGYGLAEPDRVGFGDDTAAAGGLVGWSEAGAPCFLGDALSDPLMGVAAAAAALRALRSDRAGMIDAGMAPIAAQAAALRDASVAA